MRPIKGVITSVKGQILVVQLESGLTIQVPKVPGLNIGKVVEVSYDFTKNEVKSVVPKQKDAAILEIVTKEPEPLIEIGEDDDSDILDSGSGALPLSCEGFWNFWDSGVLVLSVPSVEGCGWHDPHSS
jgi:hypothetical protein